MLECKIKNHLRYLKSNLSVGGLLSRRIVCQNRLKPNQVYVRLAFLTIYIFIFFHAYNYVLYMNLWPNKYRNTDTIEIKLTTDHQHATIFYDIRPTYMYSISICLFSSKHIKTLCGNVLAHILCSQFNDLLILILYLANIYMPLDCAIYLQRSHMDVILHLGV